MKASVFRRAAAAAVALLLAASMLPHSASAAEYPFTELMATDVTLDETSFVYTGEEIRPNVTVRVKDKLLTLDEDYYLEYADNVEVGEARVIVTGIATAGYAGTVEHPFFITEQEGQSPEFTLVELTEADVSLEGTEFAYTGQPIQPKVTVTSQDKTLMEGRDYAVEYVNNMLPGIGTVIVRGIATASSTLGYTGEVTMTFTITAAETEAPSESQHTEPSEPVQPGYKITKGDGASWFQGSTAGLSFTADGKFEDFTGVSVNGKLLDKANYSAKSGSTIVLLKNAYLKTLDTGKYTITLHFEDGNAEGTFHIEAENANPKTGDTILLPAAILLLSLTALLSAGYCCRKVR